MKCIHTTSYYIYNSKVKTNFKVALISDLHFAYSVKNDKLQAIFKHLLENNPDYIIFVGDLIDSINMVEDKNERNRFLTYLKILGSIAPVIISLGSHDFSQKIDNSSNWQYYYDVDFWQNVSQISNIYLLNNAKFIDSRVSITGFTQPFNYYYPEKEKSLLPIPEDYQEFLNYLDNNQKLLNNNTDTINIGSIHSPIYLNDREVLQKLANFDYLVSGHMHNGCVPPIIYELWPSTRGLIAPNKALLPKNERNTFKNIYDKLIVNGPLVTFQECTGILQIFNVFYPSYNSELIFTNGESLIAKNDKILTRKKYDKWQ